MSFGWSAGDIISSINLVNRVVRCLGSIGGARSHFQELESELTGLKSALQEISELANAPGQTPEIIALRSTACSCEETLKSFYNKILPFAISLGDGSNISKFKAAPKMVRWELLIKKEIPELRSYLVAHVGYLNLRMSSAVLKCAVRSQAEQASNQEGNERSLQLVEDRLKLVFELQLKDRTIDICQKISQISREDNIPKLNSLLDVVIKIWNSQHDTITAITKALDRLPAPDLRHTWLQAPVRVEDALGRIIPVPSEYDWATLEAVIASHFRQGLGSQKVYSGEYELFNSEDGSTPLSESSCSGLIPGMSLRMTIIIGQYTVSSKILASKRCPKPSCLSIKFKSFRAGSQCFLCHTWFRTSKKPLAEPLRSTAIPFIPPGVRKVAGPSSVVDTYMERRSYKNVSLHITELPETPLYYRQDKSYRSFKNSRIETIHHSQQRGFQATKNVTSFTSKVDNEGHAMRLTEIINIPGRVSEEKHVAERMSPPPWPQAPVRYGDAGPVLEDNSIAKLLNTDILGDESCNTIPLTTKTTKISKSTKTQAINTIPLSAKSVANAPRSGRRQAWSSSMTSDISKLRRDKFETRYARASEITRRSIYEEKERWRMQQASELIRRVGKALIHGNRQKGMTDQETEYIWVSEVGWIPYGLRASE